jgi:subtilisin family serine protease
MRPSLRRSSSVLPLAFALGLCALAPESRAGGSVSGPPSTAAPPSPAVALPAIAANVIDGTIGDLLAFRRKTGLIPPQYMQTADFATTGELPVVLRLATPPDAAKVARWAQHGVVLARGGKATASGAYLGTVTETGLVYLRGEPGILQVTNDLAKRLVQPLTGSVRETRIQAARRALLAKDGTYLGGAGTKIADIDSGIDLFHPAFFRADGGAFAWVDVNKNGKFDLSTDGIDRDGDGEISPAERLGPLRATLPDGTETQASPFDAGTDWLYLDENGDGARNVGSGFTEATPAFGEPIFLIDDLNGNGILDASERLLQLKTSKISKVNPGSFPYSRGDAKRGLLNYGAALHKSPDRLEAAFHGTGVSGILVGGEPGRTRLLGLAPDADLLMGVIQNGETALLQWAIDEGAAAVLTEYAPYTNEPLDGSSEPEQLLDAAVKAGVIAVSPAGNLAIGKKHRTISVPTGTMEVPLITRSDFAGSPLIGVTILHRRPLEAKGFTVEMRLPDGSKTPLDLPLDGTATPMLANGQSLFSDRHITARNTAFLSYSLVGPVSGNSYAALPRGDYTLIFHWTGATPLEVEAYVGDATTSWDGGIGFDANTPNRTVCHPATADRTLGIAAYVLHDETGYEPWGSAGVLAGYSSRGLRIDGAQAIAFAAPDNPITTALTSDDAPAAYGPFGGTSGAGPHVAASAALLRQLNPTLTATFLRQQLIDGARKDSFVGASEDWGTGKLDVAATLGLSNDSTPKPLAITLTATATPVVGSPSTFKAAGPNARRFRFDANYDGAWDGPFTTEATVTLPATTEPTAFALRAEGIDDDGNIGGVALQGATVAAPPPAPPPYEGEVGGGCTMHGMPSSTTGASGAISLLAALGALLGVARKGRRTC